MQLPYLQQHKSDDNHTLVVWSLDGKEYHAARVPDFEIIRGATLEEAFDKFRAVMGARVESLETVSLLQDPFGYMREAMGEASSAIPEPATL